MQTSKNAEIVERRRNNIANVKQHRKNVEKRQKRPKVSTLSKNLEHVNIVGKNIETAQVWTNVKNVQLSTERQLEGSKQFQKPPESGKKFQKFRTYT